MTLLDLLQQKGISFRRSPSQPDEIGIPCPYCLERRGEGDFGYSLHINLKNGRGHCWHASCDWKSHKAIHYLLLRLTGQIDPTIETGEGERPIPTAQVEWPEDFQPLTHPHDELDQRALDYLLRRGITRDQVRRKRIGVSYVGRYAYRIIFPILTPELKGLTARDFTRQQKLKYLTNPGPKYLYNFDPSRTTCILSEGVFKALRIEQMTGFSSAALLGHALTEQQMQQLQFSQCSHVILWSDSDLVGRKGVVAIADKLQEEWRKEVSVILPVPGLADEIPLPRIRDALSTSVCKYSWTSRQKLLLGVV